MKGIGWSKFSLGALPSSRCGALLLVLLLTDIQETFAQKDQQGLSVQGAFLADSVALGAPTTYLLIAKYPIDEMVRFPQEKEEKLYKPFELQERRFVPSVYADGYVVDSVWYVLATFETTPTQRLKLPIYRLTDNEKIATYASPDSIAITGLLSEDAIQSSDLKERLLYHPVSLQRNYPVIFTIIVGTLTLLTVALFASRKKILRAFRLFRLRRTYERFSRAYAKKLQAVRTHNNSIAHVEHALFFFKGYIEGLEGIPYTKLSTKEVANRSKDNALTKVFKSIDGIIYGGIGPQDAYRLLDTLDQIGFERYQKKVDLIKYGR